ncbi:MAG: DUF1761 domain-containing protein [Bacteroidota bacterium]
MENRTNYLAILLCPIINAVLGMAWYGIFRIEWMMGHGFTQYDFLNDPAGPTKYILAVIGALATAYILNMLFKRMGVTTLMDGLKTGAAIGFFGLSGIIVCFKFAMHPWSIAMIDGGFAFLLFVLYGAVLGGWQKK